METSPRSYTPFPAPELTPEGMEQRANAAFAQG
jgi:hypothetical protein